MQSACVVSRLFTLLIALLSVAARTAPAAAADHVICQWASAAYMGRVASAGRRRAPVVRLMAEVPASGMCGWIERNRKRKRPTRRRTNKWTWLNDDLWAGQWTDCDTSTDHAAWRLTMNDFQSTGRPPADVDQM